MAATRQQHRPRRLAPLLLLSLCALLLMLQPASALFGFGKKKEGDVHVQAQEAAARAGLEEAVKAEAAKRGSSKGAEPAKKPKPRAGVTARKLVKDTEIVEGANFTISYDVHNAGPLTAKAVVVDDAAGLAGLRVLEGSAVLSFEDLQPNTRVRASVVLAADTERIIPAARAKVSWTVVDPESGEESTDEGQSTTNPPMEVLSWTNYRRAKKIYTKEYTLFTLGVLPCVFFPFLVWLSLSATNGRRYGRAAAGGGKKRR